jgi:hypothetical protein
MNLDNTTIIKLAELLEGTMLLASLDDEYYFTIPVYDGAIEIMSDGKVYYRVWALDHGMRHEEMVAEVPDVPIHEMASWIRMMLLQQEYIRVLMCGADEPLIYRACLLAQLNGEEISHGTARAIASTWDFSPNMSSHGDFVRNGSITDDNLWTNIFSAYNSMSDNDKLAADMLGTYLAKRRVTGETGPVENWSKMVLDRP